ncbi:MAG TPA: chemotaxis protein CheX [Planctomycetaceae bacterium]|nr:chemotaxis protein CheX [Planctomycetaceae bacterium]
MRVELINPFLTATCDVFRMMLGSEIRRGNPGLKQSHTPEFEVSGLIGFSGSYHGMVVVSLSRDTALNITESMLGQRPEELDDEVVDTVGELTNMIAGGAKAHLEKYHLSIGLPTVICGKHHAISFPSNSVPISLPFDTDLGPICVDIGLAEAKAGAEAAAGG